MRVTNLIKLDNEWGIYELRHSPKYGIEWLFYHVHPDDTTWGPGIHKDNGGCHECDKRVPEKFWDIAQLITRGRMRAKDAKHF